LLGPRIERRPVAYITGHREFFDLDLHVAPGVLIPRPETELVVEQCLAIAGEKVRRGEACTFVDVGTGSGAIALAVAKQLPQVDVVAVEKSHAALLVAQYNAKRLRLAGRVRFFEGDLLEPVPFQVDIVAANLPYIPSDVVDALPPEIRDHEPRQALDGGPDGLVEIRRLIHQLPARLRRQGAAVLEIGHDQGPAVQALARDAGCLSCAILRDLAGLDRVALLQF
jgi:release factor glutamine methyltransferase